MVHPCCGNIGGGGFMLVRLASGKSVFLDFREKAPLKASPTMYQDADGNVIKGKSTGTWLGVGVPGTVMGLDAALKKYGTMPLSKVIAPAIKLARDGFVLQQGDINILDERAKGFASHPNVAAIFLNHGKPYVAGDRLHQEQLAQTLDKIEQGGDAAFYHGDIARAVVAASHGRREAHLVDVPCFGGPVRVVWHKRTWSCREPSCPTGTFTEQAQDVAAPRALLTVRACWWAIRQLRREHASISGLARQLGITWRTLWRAIRPLLAAMDADPARFDGVRTLGVDEHIWHHVSTKPVESGGRGPKELTGMVNLTRDAHGRTRARLLDLVPGRSGQAYTSWLTERGQSFRTRVQVATLDPFHGYKNAIDDQLADAVVVVDAFHVVKLATAMVDDVRRRTQQHIHGHRGRKNDPLYPIRNILRAGAENLTDREHARLQAAWDADECGVSTARRWAG